MAQDVPNSAVLVAGVDLGVSAFLSQTPNLPVVTNPDSIINVLATDMVVDGFTITAKTTVTDTLGFTITGKFHTTLQILNQSGQDCDSLDIQKSLQDACNEEGVDLNGFSPQQVVTGSGDGTNSGSGSAGNTLSTTGAGTLAQQEKKTSSGAPQCGDPALTLWEYPVEYISCMTNKALASVGILFIGLIIGVVVLILVQKKQVV